MSRISYTQAVYELAEVISENPNYVYGRAPAFTDELAEAYQPSCLYTHRVNGELTPGCLLGRWLHEKHDVPLEKLRQADRRAIGGIRALLAWLEIEVTPKAWDFLSVLQTEQDDHEPWGKAFWKTVKDYRNVTWRDDAA